mgnify:CR=1 FL=1
MDIAIQMRSIELMLKFLKHDLKNVPSYGYALQKRQLPEAKAPKPLPRSTPEAEGIRSDAVLRFLAGAGSFDSTSPSTSSCGPWMVKVSCCSSCIANTCIAP